MSPELEVMKRMNFLSSQLETCDETHNNCLLPVSKLAKHAVPGGSFCSGTIETSPAAGLWAAGLCRSRRSSQD